MTRGPLHQTTNLTLPNDEWFVATVPLHTHYCVVCHRPVTGRDYLWRWRLNGMLIEYVHPVCLKAKGTQMKYVIETLSRLDNQWYPTGDPYSSREWAATVAQQAEYKFGLAARVVAIPTPTEEIN